MLGSYPLDLNFQNTTPCRKVYDSKNDRITFERLTYDIIEDRLEHYPERRNEYIDTESPPSYYVLSEDNKFIISHYVKHGSPVGDSLKWVTDTFNRRIDRLFEFINRSNVIILSHHEHQGFESMYIDDEKHDLTKLEPILQEFEMHHPNVIMCNALDVERIINQS